MVSEKKNIIFFLWERIRGVNKLISLDESANHRTILLSWKDFIITESWLCRQSSIGSVSVYPEKGTKWRQRLEDKKIKIQNPTQNIMFGKIPVILKLWDIRTHFFD